MTDTWVDSDGVECYKKKAIMEWLVPRIDLNSMWDGYRAGAFPKHEFMQFYRDIGYSVAGFDEVWDWRDEEEENLTQEVTKDMTRAEAIQEVVEILAEERQRLLEGETGRVLTILCPWHRVKETITLPECYDTFFKGLIPCGHNSVPERKTVFIAVEGKWIVRLGLNSSQ